MPEYTILVPVTITVGEPGQTHFRATVDPRPQITLPAYVGRKRPVIAMVNGKPRKLSACVACLLAGHKRGDKLKARPETIRKWDAELPEFAGRCRVDVSRKGVHGFVAVFLDGLEVG